MDRWACVDVPALPLQLLCLRHPEWVAARAPIAVVDADKPNGTILWADERARRCNVRSGQRYAEGLSLAAGLCAGVVPPADVAAAVRRLAERLRRFSPDVEPSGTEPGVFWLDASGLVGTHESRALRGRAEPSLRVWAERIAADLHGVRLVASVAVGFDRFDTYALARLGRGVRVSASPDEERRRVARVPLRCLNLEPKLRDALDRLGVEDVGALRRLPAGGLLARFGADGERLERLAAGAVRAPLVPAREVEVPRERFELEPDAAAIDRTGLLFLIKQRLGRIRQALAARGEAIAALELVLWFERRAPRSERVRPAVATLDEVQLVDLVRLRLESLAFEAPCTGFELAATAAPATREQLELFAAAPRRDPRAGDRALARLRAEFGEGAVVRAVLRDGHLPEARFLWQPFERLQPAAPAECQGRLVRRVLARPQALAQQREGPDGWFVAGFAAGPVERLCGPDVVSGGWWLHERHREYYFAETRRGDLLWIYYDRARRAWWLHGVVE